MLSRPRVLVCTLALFVFIHCVAWAQANVNENLETATIYVDTNGGSDSNPGTKSEPVATIGRAASMAVSNNLEKIGTRIIINPGTYRESIALNKSEKTTTLPITFEAATPSTVTVSGADVWTDWAAGGNLYTHSWPYRWGTCAPIPPPAPLQQEVLLRQEMILVNGTSMTQILSQNAMQPGTFFVDESNGTAYIWPPSGTNMSTATVEVATRSSLFTDDQSYVVLRGLTFQNANTCRGSAAVAFTNTVTNILIDSNNFVWNNAVGLAFFSPQNFTVQSSTANHNGQKGFATHQVKYGLWQSDTANYNNWRGAQAALYTFDSGGVRLFLDHDGTFNNLVTLFNQTQGIHFDTDNENVTITSQVSAYNLYGLLLEKSEGPITVSNSYFCGNNLLSQGDASGFDFRNSTKATLTGNTFYANYTNQIAQNGIPSGQEVTNWETGETYNLINGNLTLSKNTFATASNTSHVFFDDLGGSAWTDFATSLNSDYNNWSAGTNTNPFLAPVPQLGSLTSFTGWRDLTLQDLHSTWGTAVSQPTQCQVQADAPEYWLLTSTFDPITVSPSGQASFNLTTVALGGMTGTVKLTLDGLSAIPGATASFSPATIATSGTSVLTVVTGTTTPLGTYPVTAIANAGNVTRTVTVSLVVPETSVRLSTTSLTFPGQTVRTTSKPKTFTITNTGSTALSISDFSVGKDFAETNNCGSQLKAGSYCTVSVTFTPTWIGTPSAILTIRDNDPTSPQTVTLTGTGLAK